MTLTYLSSTLSLEEYLVSRFKQDRGTGKNTSATITNAKLFCEDQFNREFIVVLADMSREVLDTNNKLDVCFNFLQKFVYWLNEDHPDLRMQPNALYKLGAPFVPKDIPAIRGYIGQMRLIMKKVGGIPISSEDIADYKLSFPPAREQEEIEPLLLDEFKMICDNQATPRRQMMYRIMRGAEARLGAMVQLRKKHFNTEVRPIQIKFPKSIMKKKNGVSFTNIKFVLQEDETGLINLLENYEDEDLVFGTNENWEQARNNEEKVWAYLMEKLKIDERYDHNGHLKKNIHSIKSMTFTAAEEAVNETYANAYGDHSRYTKTYLRWTLDKKIEKFRLLEPYISFTKYQKSDKDSKLEKQNDLLTQKVIERDELLEKIIAEKKEKTKVVVDEKTKEFMMQILKENNLI